MTSQQMRVDGAVAFHRLGEWSSLEELRSGFEAIGFKDFVPKPRTPSAAIMDAMKVVFAGLWIEPLAKPDSWEIREVVRGEESNDPQLRHIVHLRTEVDGSPKILVGPFDQEIADKLVNAFNRFIALIRAAQVTARMQEIALYLRGTNLCPGKAVYWIPGDAVERWSEACNVVRAAGASGGGNQCHIIRHCFDADALQAVCDAIREEVRTEAAQIEADVQSGELGERALEHRKEQAIGLRDKIRYYETLLDSPLSDLHASVDQAESAAATAAILSSLSGASA